MKQNKEIYIQFILDQLKSGVVSFEQTLKLFNTKHNLTRSNFSKYWKIANERHFEAMQEAQRIRAEAEAEEIKKDAKRLYLDRAQRLEIAFKIAQGSARRIDGEVIVPTDADRIRALDYIAKMEGDYQPARVAQTDSKGNDIPLLEQYIRAAKGVKLKSEIEN
jgi:hypothetical protein